MAREVIVIVALALLVALTLFCSAGLLLMRNAYERLHFITPPASVGGFLLTIAVFVAEPQLVAGLKTLLISILLLFSNAVVSHATARAARIRELGGWRTGDSLPAEGAEGGGMHSSEEPV